MRDWSEDGHDQFMQKYESAKEREALESERQKKVASTKWTVPGVESPVVTYARSRAVLLLVSLRMLQYRCLRHQPFGNQIGYHLIHSIRRLRS